MHSTILFCVGSVRYASRIHNNFQFCVNCLPHGCTFSPSRLVYQSMNLRLMLLPSSSSSTVFRSHFSRARCSLPFCREPRSARRISLWRGTAMTLNEDQGMIVIHYCFPYDFCCIHNGPFIRCLLFITYPKILNRANFITTFTLCSFLCFRDFLAWLSTSESGFSEKCSAYFMKKDHPKIKLSREKRHETFSIDGMLEFQNDLKCSKFQGVFYFNILFENYWNCYWKIVSSGQM